MKVKQDREIKHSIITYDNWPGEGQSQGIITEWENGEGYDIVLGGTILEITHNEAMALMCLITTMQIMGYKQEESQNK
jgi:hypothetical protein